MPTQTPMSPALVATLERMQLRQVIDTLWYPSPESGQPDVLLVRLPPPPDGPGFSAVFAETSADRRVVEETLDGPISMTDGTINMRKTFERTMSRVSKLPPTGLVSLNLMHPKSPGWPYLVVSVAGRNFKGQGLGRDRYAYEVYETETEALVCVTLLMAAHRATLCGASSTSHPGSSAVN